MKFRVENKEDFEKLNDLVENIKISNMTLKQYVDDSLMLKESDIQLIDKIAIITGSFNKEKGIDVKLPIEGLEIINGIIKFFIKLQVTEKNKIEMLAFQIMET